MTTSAAQLFLLSDHIKLSLLERRRASSLDLDPGTHNAEISRSLDSFKSGLDALKSQQEIGLSSDITQLHQQYTDLVYEFDGSSTPPTAAVTAQPNDPALASDFTKASGTVVTESSSRTPKSVRFRDNLSLEAANEANHTALFPYHDDPTSAEPPDHSNLDNQQIHQYHSQVLREQDTELDRLGVSVGRQRELSIAIGDDLEGQAELLDDVDQGVTRHQSQIDRARKRVDKIARKAKDNISLTIIMTLVIILILLVVLTK